MSVFQTQEVNWSENLRLPVPEVRGEVSFDLDAMTFTGVYEDQLSMYRARKVWEETLSDCFLLDRDADINLKISSDHENHSYTLNCEFTSACARYAFWRLVNHHAPEAAYVMEMAHIPEGPSKYESLVNASDLKPTLAHSLLGLAAAESQTRNAQTIIERLKKFAEELIK